MVLKIGFEVSINGVQNPMRGVRQDMKKCKKKKKKKKKSYSFFFLSGL